MKTNDSEQVNLVVHGGTSLSPGPQEDAMTATLQRVRDEQLLALERGDPAVHVVVAAVKSLEDSGLFIAGRGAEPQIDGVIRYDASLMTSDGRAGAAMQITGFKNPIEVARVFLEGTTHSTLVGDRASDVAHAMGAARGAVVSAPKGNAADWLRLHREASAGLFGTVGAVALDSAGTLAAATSTGGYRTALPGRAGDSGALGAGTFASPRCAVSCTGDGDRLLLSGLAAAYDAHLEAGLQPNEAASLALSRMEAVRASGGAIILRRDAGVVVLANVPILRYATRGSAICLLHGSIRNDGTEA